MLDILSSSMVFLSLFLLPPLLLVSEGSSMWGWVKSSVLINLFLFLSKSLFPLFLFFESSIYPMTALLLKWGYQFERLSATKYMVLYTMSFSLLFLVATIYLTVLLVTFLMDPTPLLLSNLLFMIILLPLLVKLPLYTLHLWLPKAHVEAPTVGSMILAALLLKLSGYSVVRIVGGMKTSGGGWGSLVLLSGAVMSGVSSFLQSDGKKLIAYSSVSHMNFGLFILLWSSDKSYLFNFLLMVTHGIASALLFFLVGFMYQLKQSRVVYLLSISGLLLVGWLVVLLMNFGFPPLLSSFSEIYFFALVIKGLSFSFFLLILYGIFISYASLFLLTVMYMRVSKSDLSKKEISGVFPLFLMGLSLPLLVLF